MKRFNFNNISTSGVVILPESTKELIKKLEAEATDVSQSGHH